MVFIVCFLWNFIIRTTGQRGQRLWLAALAYVLALEFI